MGLTQHAGHACLVNDGGVQGGGRGLCGAFATVVLQARDDSVLKTPPPRGGRVTPPSQERQHEAVCPGFPTERQERLDLGARGDPEHSQAPHGCPLVGGLLVTQPGHF